MLKKEIFVYDKWSLKDAEDNPKRLFIFGDNLAHVGTGGQACIRYSRAKNAHGIPTKKCPTMSDNCFFSDDEFEENVEYILEAVKKIPLDHYNEIAIPSNVWGSGLAQMHIKCPKTFSFVKKLYTNLKTHGKF